jgi:hypothetical protein
MTSFIVKLQRKDFIVISLTHTGKIRLERELALDLEITRVGRVLTPVDQEVKGRS